MTASRLFSEQALASGVDVLRAFETGCYSSEVIAYMKKHDVTNIVAKMPSCTNFVTLSPDLFALNQEKLCEIFKGLPSHVKVVNLQMQDLKPEHLSRFVGLLAHSGYAKDTSIFNLQWDFHRFPISILQEHVLSRSIPRQLTHFNFVHGPSIERVSHADLMQFKQAKLAPETHAHLDTHYHLRPVTR